MFNRLYDEDKRSELVENKESKNPVAGNEPENNHSSIEIASSSSIKFLRAAPDEAKHIATETKRITHLSILRTEINNTLRQNRTAELKAKKECCLCTAKVLGGSMAIILGFIGIVTAVVKSQSTAKCPDILLPDACSSSTSRIINSTWNSSCTDATIDTWCNANNLQQMGPIAGSSVVGTLLLTMLIFVLLNKFRRTEASVPAAYFDTVNNDAAANPENAVILPITSSTTLAIVDREREKSQKRLALFAERRAMIRSSLQPFHPTTLIQLVEEYDGCQEAKPTAPSFNI